jgi:hypothetical protein
MKGRDCVLVLLTVVFTQCTYTSGEQYKKLEKAEIESGVRYDSLFKGLYFGMSHEDFRDYCYYQNTVKHDFFMGGSNTSWLESKLPDQLSYPAAINFYPVFEDQKITEMNASIYYKDAVFKDGIFDRDSLVLDVLQLMKKWYGKELIKIKSPNSYQEDIYVSVHGNRRVTVYPASIDEVKVWIVDLYSRKYQATR